MTFSILQSDPWKLAKTLWNMFKISVFNFWVRQLDQAESDDFRELPWPSKSRLKRVLSSLYLENHLFWPQKVKENHHFLVTLESARGPDLDTDTNGFHRSQIGRRNENQPLVTTKNDITAHSIRVMVVLYLMQRDLIWREQKQQKTLAHWSLHYCLGIIKLLFYVARYLS